MRNFLTVLLVFCLVYVLIFSAYAKGIDNTVEINFSIENLLTKLSAVTSEYEPFPSFPASPSDDEGGNVDTEQNFWQRAANFFKYIGNFFKWIGSVLVWLLDSVILGFRLVACFLPFSYEGSAHGGGSGHRGGR